MTSPDATRPPVQGGSAPTGSGERAGAGGGGGGGGAGIVIRRMVEADLSAVMAIERAAFASPWTLATFTGLLRRENTRLWVAEAEAGGEGGAGEGGAGVPTGSAGIVAYAAVWMVADQAELGDIAVADGWRRRGIATRLLREVLGEMEAAGIRELFLEVRVSNEAAQALYAGHGFEAVGRRGGYYSRPKEDALVLRRELERP